MKLDSLPLEIIDQIIHYIDIQDDDHFTIFNLSQFKIFKPFLKDLVLILKINYVSLKNCSKNFIDRQNDIHSRYFTDSIFSLSFKDDDDDDNIVINESINDNNINSLTNNIPKRINLQELNEILLKFKVIIVQLQHDLIIPKNPPYSKYRLINFIYYKWFHNNNDDDDDNKKLLLEDFKKNLLKLNLNCYFNNRYIHLEYIDVLKIPFINWLTDPWKHMKNLYFDNKKNHQDQDNNQDQDNKFRHHLQEYYTYVFRFFEAPYDFNTFFNKDLKELEIKLVSERHDRYGYFWLNRLDWKFVTLWFINKETLHIPIPFELEFCESKSISNVFYFAENLYNDHNHNHNDNHNDNDNDNFDNFDNFIIKIKSIEIKFRKIIRELLMDQRCDVFMINHTIGFPYKPSIMYEFYNEMFEVYNELYHKWQILAVYLETLMQEYQDTRIINSIKINYINDVSRDKVYDLDGILRDKKYYKFNRLNQDIDIYTPYQLKSSKSHG
ncbi:hypothetical protein WICMUC_001683 [Wickerhamomyces mucosus]|uniref:Uncharacterized protein n=1 Tax=Wickerhamomyces mucosus TaxID=1378264 RepID=A0A9P8PVN8_9ASCO|nr:hypothetical protein WICMUC_001683 [Wickerhamomyces mucosus]